MQKITVVTLTKKLSNGMIKKVLLIMKIFFVENR